MASKSKKLDRGIAPEGPSDIHWLPAPQTDASNGRQLWTRREDLYVEANWSLQTARQIATHLRRTERSVRRRALDLGVQKIPNWSSQEDEILSEFYVKTGTKETINQLEKAGFHRSKLAVRYRAMEKGFKSPLRRDPLEFNEDDSVKIVINTTYGIKLKAQGFAEKSGITLSKIFERMFEALEAEQNNDNHNQTLARKPWAG